ncbi:hypothetical protein [Qipengyuania marisflavi]|uniref:Phytoene synthase n=1 Tax=Qipengyuania marisflavi TaxID=2486356 RepID=A0A5S3P931_9SPHN|nr:hypothetical protein [Qipengyuania marisflavi]TMM49946.1 hypothetical protein FEV51_01740 [Qipengyuania marisflavi]
MANVMVNAGLIFWSDIAPGGALDSGGVKRSGAPMDNPLLAELSEAGRVALASAKARDALVLAPLLAMDARLSRIVAQVREPLLAQMRLAWWRDELGKPAADRPKGDAVLGAFGIHCTGLEPAAIALVNGWEALLDDPPLSAAAATSFADGRGALLVGFSNISGLSADADEAARAGRLWAMGELASLSSEPDERAQALALADTDAHPALHLPSRLRPVAVLGGLSRRAILRGGAPLLGDRMSPLAALRLGLLGR